MIFVNPEVVYHWYCPNCERACISPYNPNSLDWRIECSDCRTVYEVRPTQRAADLPKAAAKCSCGATDGYHDKGCALLTPANR